MSSAKSDKPSKSMPKAKPADKAEQSELSPDDLKSVTGGAQVDYFSGRKAG